MNNKATRIHFLLTILIFVTSLISLNNFDFLSSLNTFITPVHGATQFYTN